MINSRKRATFVTEVDRFRLLIMSPERRLSPPPNRTPTHS
jgi:hypothetical protein